jgi:hypothetical protein
VKIVDPLQELLQVLNCITKDGSSIHLSREKKTVDELIKSTATGEELRHE